MVQNNDTFPAGARHRAGFGSGPLAIFWVSSLQTLLFAPPLFGMVQVAFVLLLYYFIFCSHYFFGPPSSALQVAFVLLYYLIFHSHIILISFGSEIC